MFCRFANKRKWQWYAKFNRQAHTSIGKVHNVYRYSKFVKENRKFYWTKHPKLCRFGSRFMWDNVGRSEHLYEHWSVVRGLCRAKRTLLASLVDTKSIRCAYCTWLECLCGWCGFNTTSRLWKSQDETWRREVGVDLCKVCALSKSVEWFWQCAYGKGFSMFLWKIYFKIGLQLHDHR